MFPLVIPNLFVLIPAIKNKPVRNEDPKDAKLREYQAEIERLRALIEQRRAGADKKLKKERLPKPKPLQSDNCECTTYY